MFRWTENTYNIGYGKKLNIITAYRVNDKTVTSRNARTTNAQQLELLKERGIGIQKPWKQFIADSIEQFEELFRDSNNYNLLLIDANENIKNPEKDGICQLIKELDLINVYQTLHSDYSNFPTHNNGRKTIDYILGSKNIMKHITKVGYLKFHECFDSDHRGVFCDISAEIFQQYENTNNIQKERIVGSNSTNRGEEYIMYIHKYLKYHNIYDKPDELINERDTTSSGSASILSRVDIIDKLVTEIMCKSEKTNCKKKDNNALWTPEIGQSNLRVQYWNIRYKSSKQRIDSHSRIQQIMKNMDENSFNILKNNTKSLKSALRKALIDHAKLCKSNVYDRREYLK
jgi:hypothetical protein